MHVHVFHIRTFCRHALLIHDVKWPVLKLYWQLEQMMTFLNLFVPSPNRSYQFFSWTVSMSFASRMIWNNGKMIAEVRSYIFKWCSRCRRLIRRLSSLMSLSIRVFAGWRIVAIAILANLPGRMTGVSGQPLCRNIYITRIKCQEPGLKLTLNWYHVSETKQFTEFLARQTPSLNEL